MIRERHDEPFEETPSRFHDRTDAGRRLAAALGACRGTDPIVLALPRGGVPVGYEVARALDAPLDVWVVRKVGVPWQPELGLGAVAEGGEVYLSPRVVEAAALSDPDLRGAIERERAEVEQRTRRFRGDRPRPEVKGRTVIVVDDGIATGGTVRAAVRAIRSQGPKEIVLAVPVAHSRTVDELEHEVNRVVCLLSRPDLFAISPWYEHFPQVEDEAVRALLDLRRTEMAEARAATAPKKD